MPRRTAPKQNKGNVTEAPSWRHGQLRAKRVANRDRPGKIKSIATFVEHLSAWELPEMADFLDLEDPKVSTVQFNIFPQGRSISNHSSSLAP